MARFMIMRSASPAVVSHHVNLSCQVCVRESRAEWIRCCYSFERGLLFCEWEAPDRETLHTILAECGFPAEDIVEVQSITPAECHWTIFGDLED